MPNDNATSRGLGAASQGLMSLAGVTNQLGQIQQRKKEFAEQKKQKEQEVELNKFNYGVSLIGNIDKMSPELFGAVGEKMLFEANERLGIEFDPKAIAAAKKGGDFSKLVRYFKALQSGQKTDQFDINAILATASAMTPGQTAFVKSIFEAQKKSIARDRSPDVNVAGKDFKVPDLAGVPQHGGSQLVPGAEGTGGLKLQAKPQSGSGLNPLDRAKFMKALQLTGDKETAVRAQSEALTAGKNVQAQLEASPELVTNFLGTRKAALFEFATNKTLQRMSKLLTGKNTAEFFSEEERQLWDSTEKMFQKWRKITTGAQASDKELKQLRPIIIDIMRTPGQFAFGLKMIQEMNRIGIAHEIARQLKGKGHFGPDILTGTLVQLPGMDDETAQLVQDIMKNGNTASAERILEIRKQADDLVVGAKDAVLNITEADIDKMSPAELDAFEKTL